MSDDLDSLRRAARQLIETDRQLAGDLLVGGTPVPAPPASPAPVRTPVRAPVATVAPADPTQCAIAPPDSSKWMNDPEGQRRQALLDELAGEVGKCCHCGLGTGRRNAVPGEGSPLAKLLFIGEAPGEDEDRFGRPFVGASGDLLTKMIGAMGLTRSDVYIANVVKCRPPGNRAPTPAEAEACRPFLIRQLLIIQPRVIVTLGNPATHAILHTTEGITSIRGQWRLPAFSQPELAHIRVMPTFHPAFVLRNYTADARGKVWSDLQAVMKELSQPAP